MDMICSSRFAGLLRNGNAMGRFYMVQISIASTTLSTVHSAFAPCPSASNCCARRWSSCKTSSVSTVHFAEPSNIDHNWYKIVQLQDTHQRELKSHELPSPDCPGRRTRRTRTNTRVHLTSKLLDLLKSMEREPDLQLLAPCGYQPEAGTARLKREKNRWSWNRKKLPRPWVLSDKAIVERSGRSKPSSCTDLRAARCARLQKLYFNLLMPLLYCRLGHTTAVA